MSPTSQNQDPINRVSSRPFSPERFAQLLVELGRIRELVAECIASPSGCKEALICRQIREMSLPLCQLSLARVIEVLNSSAQCVEDPGGASSERRLRACAEVVDDVICYIESLRDGYSSDDEFLESIEDKIAFIGTRAEHDGKPGLLNCPAGVMADFLDGVNASLRDIRSVLSQWQEVPNHKPLATELLRQLHALKGAVLVYGVDELVGNIQYLESCVVGFLKDELKACATLFELLERYVTRMKVVIDLLVKQQSDKLLKSLEKALPLPAVGDREHQPLSQKLPRLRFLVERASMMLGKSVRLIVTGDSVRLPAELAGKLIAPLELLLWNAIDHGIEAPVVRAAAGKPKDGVITLSLRLEENETLGVITVADDGAGIDEAAVRERAVKSGYVASSQEAKQKALAEMIFHSGLSTSPVVSPVSGRGVGLDVVNTEVSRLGGTVQVRTSPGKGASFTLSVPL